MGGDKRFDKNEELIRLAKNGDIRAMNELTETNLPLVSSICKKFMNRGYEYDDLFQIGSMGLVKAIKNFNASYDVRFSTYAVPMIMGEIKRFLRDDGPIKVSRSVKVLATQIKFAKEELQKLLDRPPTIQELSKHTKIAVEDITNALDSINPIHSLDETIHQNDGSPILLIDKLSEQSEDFDIIDKIALKDSFNKLDIKQKQVMDLRYNNDKTQVQTAKILSISQVQVSRLEKKALRFIKECMEDGKTMAKQAKFEMIDFVAHCKKYGTTTKSLRYFAERNNVSVPTLFGHLNTHKIREIAKGPFIPLPNEDGSEIKDTAKPELTAFSKPNESKAPELFAGAGNWKTIDLRTKEVKTENPIKVPYEDVDKVEEMLKSTPQNITLVTPTKVIEVPAKPEVIYRKPKGRLKPSVLQGEQFEYRINKESISILAENGHSINVDKKDFLDFIDELKELSELFVDEVEETVDEDFI